MSHRRGKFWSRAPVRRNMNQRTSNLEEVWVRGRVLATLAEHEQTLLRSQSGPLAGTPFSAAPSNWLTRIEPHLFEGALLEAPPSPSPSFFMSVSLWPFFGRLWPSSRCVSSGYAVESVAARVCREGGARVAGMQFFQYKSFFLGYKRPK